MKRKTRLFVFGTHRSIQGNFNNILCKVKFLSHRYYHLTLYSYTVCLAICRDILCLLFEILIQTSQYFSQQQREYFCVYAYVRVYAREGV